MRAALIATLAVLAAAPLAPSPAAAQEDRGPVVAERGEHRLHAKDERASRGAEFCLALTFKNESRSSSCSGRAPDRPTRGFVVGLETEAKRLVLGAAVVDAARLEAELPDGTRVSEPLTASAAYTGRARERMRFALVELATSPVLVRFFDAQGKLVGATDPGRFSGPGEDRPANAVTLLAKRRGTAAVRAFSSLELEPTPISLDRLTRSVCLEIGNGATCTRNEVGPALLSLSIEPACAPGVAILYGFAPPAVAEVRVLLGSGRTLTVPATSLEALGAKERAVALHVPRGEAVRSATGLDAAGAVVRSSPIKAAPSGLRCPKGSQNGPSVSVSLSSFADQLAEDPGAAATDGQELAAALDGGPRLFVRDEGESLCVGFDRLAADRRDCALPEADPFTLFAQRAEGTRRVYGGVVPGDVASVRLELDDGTSRSVATARGTSYTGRYRDTLRFWALEVPAEAYGGVALDAAGAEVAEVYSGAGRPARATGTVYRSRAGQPAFSLFAALYDFRFRQDGKYRRRTIKCLALALGERAGTGAGEECAFAGVGDANAAAEVTCGRRAIVVYGRLGPRVRGVLVHTARATLRARAIALPKRLGGGRAFVLVLGPRERVRSVRFLGRLPAEQGSGERPKQTQRMAIGPAARQCGYVTASG